MIASILRAALPPLVAVVTLPIVLGRVSLSDYGLWATITGLIGVLATIDAGLATDVSRKVAAARGANDNAGVVQAGRHGLMVAAVMGAVIMPVAALLGWPIIQLVAPPSDFNTGIALWLGVIVYQSIGWYYAILASVVTGLQRGDVANAVNAMGALVGAGHRRDRVARLAGVRPARRHVRARDHHDARAYARYPQIHWHHRHLASAAPPTRGRARDRDLGRRPGVDAGLPADRTCRCQGAAVRPRRS